MNLRITNSRLVLVCVCALALLACKESDDDAAGSDGGSTTGGTAGTAASEDGGAGQAGHDAGTAGNTAGTSAQTADASNTLDDAGAACAPCIGDAVAWGANGGFVAYSDHSELASCNVYRHTRVPSGRAPSQDELGCERPVPCMGSGLHGISDVLQALEHPDVIAARAQKMVLYGVDTRPVDGTVFRIELEGSVIDVGNPCTSGSSACTKIPDGISALKALLQSIDDEQLAIEPCLATFGD